MKTQTVILIVLLASGWSESLSQWTFTARISSAQPHGVAVTPDGNVWIAAHGQTGDFLGGQALASIHVYQPDGSQAPFSPIRTITVEAVTDTLFRLDGGARGITTDNNGNILFSYRDKLFRIDYTTGLGTHRVVPKLGQALTAAAATSTNTTPGDIVVGHVLEGNPIHVFDEDFTPVGQATDSTKQIARTLAISADGNDMFFGATTGDGTVVYSSQNGTSGPYSPADTLFRGMITESFTWHPVTQRLWTSSRSEGADSVSGINWSANTWYEIDLSSNTLTDSITWQGGSTDFAGVPRGIAFSLSGDTAYVCGFEGHTIQVFSRTPALNVHQEDLLPEQYSLDQNFPNPFNPETRIRFSIPEGGLTRLVVYDIRGREVNTLLDRFVPRGVYTVPFNGAAISSGTYIYELLSGKHRLTRTMILVK